MPIILLVAIVTILVSVGDQVGGKAAALNIRAISAAASDRNPTQTDLPISYTTVSTSSVYLPVILKPGVRLRDFALPVPLFAADSAWNQTATAASILPGSAQQILVTYRVLRGHTARLEPVGSEPVNWPFIIINYDDYSVPIFRAGASQASVYLCDYDGILQWPHPKFNLGQLGGPVTLPAPAGEIRPSGPQSLDADGHLVIYDTSAFTAYDYFAATTQRDGQCQSWGGGYAGSQIVEAGAIDLFDVRGSGTNVETLSSKLVLMKVPTYGSLDLVSKAGAS